MYRFLFGHKFLVRLDIYLVGLVGYMVTVFSLLRSCQTVFQSGCTILYSQSVMYEVSSFSTSLSTFVIVCPFDFSYPGGCEVVSHYGFDLRFPED